MTKIAGSESTSRSISQRHGSSDPDPDPHQNVMDLLHWSRVRSIPDMFTVLYIDSLPLSAAGKTGLSRMRLSRNMFTVLYIYRLPRVQLEKQDIVKGEENPEIFSRFFDINSLECS